VEAVATWSMATLAVVRRHREVTMSTTIHEAPGPPLAAPTSKARERVRKILLASGPLSALTYIGWRELAALRWEGYSRISTPSASCN
jgi:hypothetical protein